MIKRVKTKVYGKRDNGTGKMVWMWQIRYFGYSDWSSSRVVDESGYEFLTKQEARADAERRRQLPW